MMDTQSDLSFGAMNGHPKSVALAEAWFWVFPGG